MSTRRHPPLALRLLAAPLTVLVILAGLWVTGGVITNDFTIAMLLTVAWMGLAGLIALALAIRSRPLRWPVLGAYVLTAAVAGFYLGQSLLFDDEVNEKVAVAAPAPAGSQQAERRPADRQQPENVLLRSGSFAPVAHSASGEAQVIELAEGGRVLTLTDFEVDNGPDLRVYMVAGPASSEEEVNDYVDLGGLKGNEGDQQYEIPDDVEVDRYETVVIWCRAFSVLFARAPTRA
jgi:hypothetical protein